MDWGAYLDALGEQQESEAIEEYAPSSDEAVKALADANHAYRVNFPRFQKATELYRKGLVSDNAYLAARKRDTDLRAAIDAAERVAYPEKYN